MRHYTPAMVASKDNFNGLADALLVAIGDDTADWSEPAFSQWAARISALQTGREVASIPSRLDALDATSTDTFRYARVATFRPDEAVATFRTSGTTAGLQGVHELARTDVYEASALTGLRRVLLGQLHTMPLKRLIALVPTRSVAPESSLAFMLDSFAKHVFPGRAEFVLGDEGIELPRLERALDDAVRSDEATLLFTTTLAAAALLDSELRAALPPGSLILTTGGAKGRWASVDPVLVDAELASRFAAAVGAEYGMTELLSQAYRVGDDVFVLPPWCRVLAIDPRTSKPTATGQPGLLRFIDLANVQSALAVQTADLGTTTDGCRFRLLGRAKGAPLRGCSVAFEDLVGEASA